jgi:hypothetical protein
MNTRAEKLDVGAFIRKRVKETLEQHTVMGTVELVERISPEVKWMYMSRMEDSEVKYFVRNVIQSMRLAKAIFPVGSKSVRMGNKVCKCLVVSLSPEPPKVTAAHQETLRLFQEAARHYLETRQFDKMGLA